MDMQSQQLPSVKNLLEHAWKNVSGMKWQILWPLLLMGIITGVLMVTLTILFGGQFPEEPQGIHDYPVSFLFLAGAVIVIMGIFTWFVTASLVMLGVYRSNNLTLRFKDAFRECKKVLKPLSMILIVTILIGLLINIIKAFIPDHGLVALLLLLIVNVISLYLTLPLTIFAIPFVVTKTHGPKEAIKQSYALMKVHAVTILLCFIVMIILTCASAIPFGIGLIWTIPMMYMLQGVIFTQVTGLKASIPSKN